MEFTLEHSNCDLYLEPDVCIVFVTHHNVQNKIIWLSGGSNEEPFGSQKSRLIGELSQKMW